MYHEAVFSLLFIGCYEVEQGTGSKFGPQNIIDPVLSTTSICPVQQPIENWQLKYVFKTIFSLVFLSGGGRGNKRSCSSASCKIFLTFVAMVGAQTCPTPAPPSLHPLHCTTPFLWSRSFDRLKPIALKLGFATDLKELFPSVSMDVYGHLATKKWTRRQSTRHQQVSSLPSNVSALINVFTHLGLLT